MALRMSMPSYIAMIAALIASLNLYSSFCKVSQDLTSEIYRNIVHRICRYSWGLHFCLRKWISMVGSSLRVSNCLLIFKSISTCQYNSIRAAYREKWSPPNALPNTFQISLHPTWRPIALPPRDSSSATCAWRHFTSLQLASNRMPRWVVCLVGKTCCWCWTLQRECDIIARSPPSWKKGLFVQFWMLPKSWIWWYDDEETRLACQKNPSWDTSMPFWGAITFFGVLVRPSFTSFFHCTMVSTKQPRNTAKRLSPAEPLAIPVSMTKSTVWLPMFARTCAISLNEIAYS